MFWLNVAIWWISQNLEPFQRFHSAVFLWSKIHECRVVIRIMLESWKLIVRRNFFLSKWSISVLEKFGTFLSWSRCTKSAVVTKVKYQKIHSIPSEIGVFWETKYEGEGFHNIYLFGSDMKERYLVQQWVRNAHSTNYPLLKFKLVLEEVFEKLLDLSKAIALVCLNPGSNENGSDLNVNHLCVSRQKYMQWYVKILNRTDEKWCAGCEYSSVITKNHKTLIAFGRTINWRKFSLEP